VRHERSFLRKLATGLAILDAVARPDAPGVRT
jgi:hypothetical protein